MASCDSSFKLANVVNNLFQYTCILRVQQTLEMVKQCILSRKWYAHISQTTKLIYFKNLIIAQTKLLLHDTITAQYLCHSSITWLHQQHLTFLPLVSTLFLLPGLSSRLWFLLSWTNNGSGTSRSSFR